jgi:hypothetical protein
LIDQTATPEEHRRAVEHLSNLLLGDSGSPQSPRKRALRRSTALSVVPGRRCP